MDFADRRTEMLRFLDAVYRYPHEGADLSLFFLPAKTALRPASFEEAAQEACTAALDERVHTYLTCCLLTAESAAKGPHHRGTRDDAVVIPGVWVDLDLAGPAHKSDALPPDQEAGLALLAAMYFEPSLIVDSGHGLYGWWLFDKPRYLADPDARERAHRLVQGCQLSLGHLAAARGWTVDGTADLARVLRPPGTINHKIEGDPRPVRILHESGKLYAPADLVAAWAEAAPKKGPAAPLPERITAGNRTKSIESLAGTLHRRNVDRDAILAAALVHNAKVCDPPLPEAKVEETVVGITTRYESATTLITPNGNGSHGGKEAPPLWQPVWLDRVVARHTEWLWHPFLPLGKLVIHAGEPGMMKSSFDVAVAAQITNGIGFAERFGPRNVVFLNFEDDDEDGLTPRLMAAGADLSRCASVPNEAGAVGLIQIVKAVDPIAVFVDPFGSWAEAAENTGLETQVRQALLPLRHLAYTTGALVKVNCHPNKQNSLSDALYRISGSLGGMVGFARVVLASKREGGQHTAGIVKSNVGPDELGVEYFAKSTPVEIEGKVAEYPRVLFGSVVTISRKNFFAVEEQEAAPNRVMVCAEEIRKLLKDGQRFAKDVKADLLALGFGRNTIQDARNLAGVETLGQGNGARWRLPRGGCQSEGGSLATDAVGEVDLTEGALSAAPPAFETPPPLEYEEGEV